MHNEQGLRLTHFVLALAVLGVTGLATAPSYGQEPGAPQEAKPEGAATPESWQSGARPQLEIAADVGQMIGFHIAGEAQALTWRYGELGIGGLFSTQFHFWHDPGHLPAGLTLGGTEASVRIAARAGHTLRLDGRRLGLGAHVFGGFLMLQQNFSLEDLDHGLDEKQTLSTPHFEVGISLSMRIRIDDRGGLHLDFSMPLWLSDAPGIPVPWVISGPTIGIGATIYL